MSAESGPGFSFSPEPPQGSEHVTGRASVPNRIDPHATGEVPAIPGAIPGVPAETAGVPAAESSPAQPAGPENPAETSQTPTADDRLAELAELTRMNVEATATIAALFARKPAAGRPAPPEYGRGQKPITVRATASVGDPTDRRLLRPVLPVLQPDGSKRHVPARMRDAEGIRRAWSDESRFGPQATMDQIPSSPAKSKLKLDNDRAGRRDGWVRHELEVRDKKLRDARAAAPAAARARAKAAYRARRDELNPPGWIRKSGRAIGRGTMSAIRGVRHAAAEHLLPTFLDFGTRNRGPSNSRTANFLRNRFGINLKKKRAPYV